VFLQILNVIKTYHLSVFSLRLCVQIFFSDLASKGAKAQEAPFYTASRYVFTDFNAIKTNSLNVFFFAPLRETKIYRNSD